MYWQSRSSAQRTLKPIIYVLVDRSSLVYELFETNGKFLQSFLLPADSKIVDASKKDLNRKHSQSPAAPEKIEDVATPEETTCENQPTTNGIPEQNPQELKQTKQTVESETECNMDVSESALDVLNETELDDSEVLGMTSYLMPSPREANTPATTVTTGFYEGPKKGLHDIGKIEAGSPPSQERDAGEKIEEEGDTAINEHPQSVVERQSVESAERELVRSEVSAELNRTFEVTNTPSPGW